MKTGDELEALASGFNTMVDGLKERDKLRTTFGKYMTASVMEHLMAGKVALGGESLEVTILFTDIRSFTTLSEKMDPQQLVGLLNEYFTEMVGIVMEMDGVVDKYIGDAIMAVFGAPVPKPEDAVNAVRAAVHMRRALQHLNNRLAERGIPPLRTGIGIHTGPVVAGNIGSERRMEYTVIGDAVNLASRLESNTKDLGVQRADQRGHLRAGQARRPGAAGEGDHRQGPQAAGDDVRGARPAGRAAARHERELEDGEREAGGGDVVAEWLPPSSTPHASRGSPPPDIGGRTGGGASEDREGQRAHFALRRSSSSSSVFGQSSCIRRDSERSASSLPPVWHLAQ